MEVTATIEFEAQDVLSTFERQFSGVVEYTVWQEKQTRHHPGGRGVEDIEVLKLKGNVPEQEEQVRALFRQHAENNPELLIEHAGDLEEQRRIEQAEKQMEEQRLQKAMEGRTNG